ncbi:cytochrome c oxidase biogenesis protein [Flavobacterium cauense R2A-7]|uniref:Protein SCO1/2 n=1 Tax=Flavobacterium cauense R2A-7 TaxID=1341154 RepID=V6S651_9FLAO|nr:SCO family protein [Flavobacterium cauense]ESU21899.1 cytochrome c oxidase biogenesis protein [Flavobacterium cauense R2A-7]KGO81429.1 cytochrome C oxidase assembly protein [Flavobacterium cauense R2A-7]TWI13116.1 protein SCO1/2 [Flavobacterium cauense R2A-7]
MIAFFKKYIPFFIVLGILSVIIITLFYTALKPKKTLPIYTPSMVNPELVDSTIQHIANKKEHHIADFAFTNQNGKTITQKDYEGKIYVADFFFTTCQTICPIMTDNMTWLQTQIKNKPEVMLLSHSVTPDIDSVSVLKKYAQEKGVIDSKWNLVTGNKKDIYYIARKSYLAVKTGKPEELYDMVHTENFVLVDQKRRVRGFYDGTKKEEVERLLTDINFLIEEEK